MRLRTANRRAKRRADYIRRGIPAPWWRRSWSLFTFVDWGRFVDRFGLPGAMR